MNISVRLDDQLRRRVAAAARAEGISMAELICRCLDKYLVREGAKPSAWEVGKHLFGCFDSRKGDLSVRAKEIALNRISARRAKGIRP